MTKTKAQLRAEAVERLRDTDAWLSTSADLINAMLGDRCEVGMANKRRYFIDLLTDEEPPEGDAVSELRLWAETDQSHEDPEHVLVERRIMSELADMVERDYVRVDSEDNPGYVRRQRYIDMKAERDELQRQLDTMRDVTREFRDERDEWKAKAKKRDFKDEMADLLFRTQMPLNEQREYLKKVSQDSEMDTREKLEEDVQEFANVYYANNLLVYDKVIELLDRQAAITTQECTDVYVSGCEACRRAQKREIAELQAKVDDLKEELEDEKSENGWVRDFLNRMGRKCGTKDCPSLVAYVGQLEAENEQLREKLSRAYDNAHDTLRTM